MAEEVENQIVTQVDTAADATIDLDETSSPPEGRSKPSAIMKVIVAVLLLALVVLGFAVWVLWAKPFKSSSDYSAAQHATVSPVMQKKEVVIPAVVEADVVKAEITQPEQPASPVDEKDGPNPVVVAAVEENDLSKRPDTEPTTSPALTSTQLLALTDGMVKLQASIHDLQQELEAVKQQQRAVHGAQLSMQKMQLHARLSWITNPDSRLPQLWLAWQEISTMPGLNVDQRSEAMSMAALAQARVHDIQVWKKQLQQAAPKVAMHLSDNVIASDEWWQEWITTQLSVRQMPTLNHEQKHLRSLQGEQIILNLLMEQWPDDLVWQKLRLQLMQQGKRITIPESFIGIANDVNTLRQVARQWKEQQ